MLSHLLYSFNLPRIIPRTREKIIKPMRPEIFKLVLLCENKEGGEGKRERETEKRTITTAVDYLRCKY